MQTPSRMLLRLNVETRAQHPEADHPWLDLMSTPGSRARYIDHLVAVYGFEAPVEAALALTPHLNEIISLRPRARSGFIVEDLLALGLTASRLARTPQCREILPFRDPAEALGWLYVIERPTLLHEAVRQHLATRMTGVPTWSYLSAYHGFTSERWQELGAALDSYAITPACGEAIVAGARAAFDRQRDWFATEPAHLAHASWGSDLSLPFARD
jgi:heme oxygenase (biliverdin-IX-beta and delta-forming)